MSTATLNPQTNASDPWSMEVGKGGGQVDYVLCPAGNYPATIVGLFDVGHQPAVKDDGTSYERRDLILVFELAKKRPDGKPFVLANRYTWSMRDNSKFYGLACSLTGKKFNEGDRFDPRMIVGQACQVQVSNSQGKTPDKVYHNIANVAQLMEGYPAPPTTIPPVTWSVLGGQPLPDTSWVPYIYGQSVKDMVQMSSEYKSGKVASVEGAPATSQPQPSEGEERVPFRDQF